MLQLTIKQRRVSHAMSTAIATIGLLLGCIASTSAQQSQRTSAPPTSQLSSARLTDLENAFWVCDYVATTRGTSEIAACTAVYEAVKERKFAGDFEKLVAWWRENKAAQHQNIAAADSADQ